MSAEDGRLMAVPLPDRLLIVSHVLVRRSGEGLYLGGGFGRFLDSIAVHYREVAILTCYQEVPVAPDEYRLRSDNVEVLGIRPYATGGRLRRYTSMLLSAAHAALKLPSALRRADVLHARLPSAVGAVGALAGRMTSKTCFLYIAGDWAAGLLYRSEGVPVRWLAAAVQSALEFLVDGHLTFVSGRPLTEKFGGPSERVVSVITTSIDASHVVSETEAAERAARPPGELLFVGLVWQMKGVHVMLRSVRELLDRGLDLRLRIIGSMADGGGWVRDEIARLGLDPVVGLVSHMAWDRLIREYDRSDVFVMPSLEGRGETGPKVVLEAMARGLPVVASSVGFVPVLVDHGRNGWIVTPGSSAEITEAVEALWSDPGLRVRFATEGIRTAREHHLDAFVRNMVERVERHRAA